MSARAIDSASIVFGLVAIPVKIISSSAPSHEVHFHMVHAGCGERLKQHYECPKHGKVERSEIAKGKDGIEIGKEELAATAQPATDEIAITDFVPIETVDPIYVERTYYLGPDRGGDRPYRLLRDALEESGLAAIAGYGARGKLYTVMLRAYDNGIAMHQLRYYDEIKPFEEVGIEKLPKPAASELELATMLVEQLKKESFDPTAYRDEVKERVKKLLAAKEKHRVVTAPDEEVPRHAEVPDLLAALRASLGDAMHTPIHRAKKKKRAR